MAKFLIQNRERTTARRQHGGLPLYAGDRVGKDANGVVVTPLRLIEHGLVVHDFEAARSVLASFQKALFSAIELMHLAVDLRDAQINIGIIGHQVGKLLIDGEGIGILFLSHQGLAEPALVA